MGTVTLGDRIVVELSDAVELRQQPAGRRSLGRAAGTELELDSALAESGFEIDADFELVPVPPRRSRTEDVEPSVEVRLAPEEEAVLLLESEGGVFTWVRGGEAAGRTGAGRRSAASRVVRFDLAVARDPASGGPGQAPRRRGIIGWVGKRLVDPIRVRVLKFVARAAIDAAVDWIEGDRPFGLVSLAGEPETWVPGGYSGLPAANRPLRILLMVHGTFSTTAGSFTALAGTEEGRRFLVEAGREYDAILGFDHPTLAADPGENARALAAALEDLPIGSHVDAIAYSRGGLVYRAFAETLCPELRPDLRFGRAVFVGCTNGGTNLANPENWREMIDLYTNIVMAGARALTLAGGIGSGALVATSISTLGRLVQALPEVAVEERRVPGLAAMEPDGAFVSALNSAGGDDREASDYFVVASDFEPRIDPARGLTGELAQYLIDRVADRLFGEENDLVVHTRSMSEFGRKAGRLGADGMIIIPAAEVVYHTLYFASERLATSLRKWLTGPGSGARPGSGAVPSDGSGRRSGGAVVDDRPPSDRGDRGYGRGWNSRGDRSAAGGGGRGLGGEAGGSGYGGFDRGSRADFGSGVDGDGGSSSDYGGGDFHDHGDDRSYDRGYDRGADGDDGGLERVRPSGGSGRRGPAVTASRPEPEAAAAPSSCHFAAEMNPTPLVGVPATLFVTISPHGITVAEGPASAVTEKPIPLDASMKIQIEIIPARNCRVLLGEEDVDRQGSACREIDVPTRSSECLRFLLEGDAAGPAEVFIEARQGPRLLASFLLKPNFIAATEERLSVSQVARPTSALEDEPAVLRIYEMHQATGLRLRFELSCDSPNIGVLESVDLRPGFDLSAFVADFLAKLENAYNLSGDDYRAFLDRISEFAIVSANDLIPRKIREQLWEHRADIKGIQVISEDPLIPWELMYVADPKGGSGRRGFLSEWGVIRWLYNARWPRRELRLRDNGVFYVVPEYLDDRQKLPGAAAERQMLIDRFPGARQIEARSADVRAFLQERAGECDILHFACHGEAQQRAVLSSELLMAGSRGKDGKVRDDYVSMDLVTTNADFGGDPPSGLVFINACQTGRQGEGIAGVAGFANSFIRPMTERGAAAFIGALWSVSDKLALSFADTVYRGLLDGLTLVEAVKRARQAADSNSDFTWLAYTVYGNPFARLVRASGRP